MATLHKYTALLLLGMMAFIAGCSKEAKLARYRQRADKHFAAGQYADAEIEYKNIIRSFPGETAAYGQLGLIYFEQGRLPQATVFLAKAHEVDPDNLTVSGKLGVAYAARFQLKQAEQLALQMLAKQPTNEQALIILADTATTADKVKPVRDRIHGLQATNTDQAAFHIVLGELSMHERDFTAAQAELEKAVALQSTNVSAQLALANVYLAKEDRAKAGEHFKAAAANAPWRSSARLKYADFKVQSGAVDEGKAMLNEMIKQVPDYVPSYVALMNLAYNQRNFEECAVMVQKVLIRDDFNFEARVTDGRMKLAQGQTDEAIAALEKADNLYPHVPIINHNLALAYLRKGDSSKAVARLNQAIAANGYPPSVLVLAEMDIAKGDFDKATRTLTQLIERYPDMKRAYLLLAQDYLQQRQYDEAAAEYRKIADRWPQAPEPYFLIGATLMVQKKYTEARVQFEKALSISPTYIQALEQLVDIDIAQKNYTAALDRVKKFSDPAKPAAPIQILLAKIHSSEKNYAEAEKDLLKAIELAPANNSPYLLLSQLYVQTHKQQEALDRLTKFAAKTNDVPTLLQIGLIQESISNYTAARDSYEKVLSIKTNFSVALNNLAYLYSEHLNDLDKGQKLAERAHAASGNDPATADTLGWIIYKRGDYARARTLLRESADKADNDVEIQYHLGLAHYMLGEEPAARAALQRVAGSATAKAEFKQDAERHLAVLDGMDASGKPLSREALEKLSADNPNDPIVLARLAAQYEAEGATDKAIALYQRALKSNRKNTQVLLKVAQYYAHEGKDPAQALELAKEAHGLAPYDAQVNRLLGRLVLDAGDYAWSVSLLQEAARNNPTDGDLSYDLAWAYYNTGKLGDAEVAMRSALQTGTKSKDDASRFITLLVAYNNPATAATVDASDTKYVPAQMVAAARFQKENQSDKAKAIYEQILAKNPLFTPASRDLAVLLAHENSDDAKAYQLATKAREAFPDDADVARALGILSYRKGDYRRAVDLLKEAQQKRAEDGETFFYLGMAYYKLKQSAESKTALQQALQWKVDTKLSAEATKVLAELK